MLSRLLNTQTLRLDHPRSAACRRERLQDTSVTRLQDARQKMVFPKAKMRVEDVSDTDKL